MDNTIKERFNQLQANDKCGDGDSNYMLWEWHKISIMKWTKLYV